MLWNCFGLTLQNPRQDLRPQACLGKVVEQFARPQACLEKEEERCGTLGHIEVNQGQAWSMVKWKWYFLISIAHKIQISLCERIKKTGIDPDTRCINWPGQRWQPATFQRKLQIAWAMEFKKTSQMVSFGSFCLIVIVSSLWFISCCCANNLTMK